MRLTSRPDGTHMAPSEAICTLSHNTRTPTYQPPLLPKPPLVPSHIGATPIHTIPFLFPPSGVVSAPVMATLSLPGLTLGLPVWYLSPPVPPPTPDVILQPVQPIVTTSQPTTSWCHYPVVLHETTPSSYQTHWGQRPPTLHCCPTS